MRIVDADKVKRAFIGNRYGTKAIEYVIDNVPTVKAIPLDKPFCKMAYGDYVCYNRNWLMKHLPMEMDILQGEAIPVEFIEKQIEKALSVDSVDLFYVGSLKHLIKDWEKENETN